MRVVLFALTILAVVVNVCVIEASEPLSLNCRARQETAPGNGCWNVAHKTLAWAPEKTAVIVIDMWEKHWCDGAQRRGVEMAPFMNDVLKAARRKGLFVIYAPSGGMGYYRNTPQRRLAEQAPAAKPPAPIRGWCHEDPDHEPPQPDVAPDGACRCQPPCRNTCQSIFRQIAALEIAEGDAVSDSGQEIFNLLQDRGIDNVILMGVHTDACVIGRPFGIRQMIYLGKNVVLCRDLTDSFRTPRDLNIDHFDGTDMIVEHIEKYWCPTITSTALTGKPSFRFQEDHRRR